MRLRKFHAGYSRRFRHAQILLARSRRTARGHAEERLRAPLGDFLHKVFQNRRGAFFRYDLPFPNGKTHVCQIRGLAQEPFCLVPVGAHLARILLRSHARRLGQNNAVTEFINFRCCRTEIDCKFYHTRFLIERAFPLRSRSAVP